MSPKGVDNMTRPDRIRRVASVALRDDPFQREKVAQAERVILRACSIGRRNARALQATREAQEAELAWTRTE